MADPAIWAQAYAKEIARIAELTGPRRLDSIFFGGGTPSLMPPDLVEGVIEAARRSWGFANRIEITMEANPGSADAARFASYRAAGVNRMSIGVQSLREADLRALGRLHSVDEARAAIDLAMGLFERVSFDLIYARQNQRPDDWVEELEQALSIGTSHMSLYQLTIEPGTAFASRHAAGGLRGLPDDDQGADMYASTQEICASAGLPAYEVSNHAVGGAECRHNLIYWTAGDWAGIGPGAHGRLTIGGVRTATRTPLQPAEWLRLVHAGSGELPAVEISPTEQAREYLLSGLRLQNGIELSLLGRMLGRQVDGAPIRDLVEWGMVLPQDVTSGRLRPTTRGFAVLDSIIRYLDQAWID